MNYKAISTAEELIEELKIVQKNQKIKTFDYYLSEEDDNIITNVPKKLYRKELKKYIPPLEIDNNFVNLLKQNINLFHDYPETESFQLNRCFENSENIFEFLKQLDNNQNFNIICPVKIVYGYFSRKTPLNTVINGKVLIKEFILHDWHVWNYINKFIIDVSLLKTGTFLNINSNTPTSWKNADDHVFVKNSDNIEYYGAEFDNRRDFVNDFRKTFDI